MALGQLVRLIDTWMECHARESGNPVSIGMLPANEAAAFLRVAFVVRHASCVEAPQTYLLFRSRGMTRILWQANRNKVGESSRMVDGTLRSRCGAATRQLLLCQIQGLLHLASVLPAGLHQGSRAATPAFNEPAARR